MKSSYTMRLLLIITFVVLSNAQNFDFNDALAWVREVTQDTTTTTTTTTEKPLGNRFLDPNSSTPKSKGDASDLESCITKAGQQGKCVKPLNCRNDPEPSDPTTRYIYRLGGCEQYQVCCPINQLLLKNPKPPKKLPKVCGVSNPGGHMFRSSKSDFSDFGEFPWMVALLTPIVSMPWKQTEEVKEHLGGGTLIHPAVVLTTAHKVAHLNPNQLKCRAGEWDHSSDMEILPHQDRNVKRIAYHEEFSRAHSRFNAALLFLESPFDITDVYHIGIACLGSTMPPPRTSCFSMGWGQSVHSDYASLLKKIQLPLVEDSVCEAQYRRPDLLTAAYNLHNTLTCAGGEDGIDTCYGDGGSSLVCPLPSYKSLKRYAVYGMVAYGMGCGLKDVPGVYAKVPSMIDWIDRKMDQEGLSKDYKLF